MENMILQAETRGTSRHQVRELRAAAQIPAVLYGRGTEAQSIAVDARALQKALSVAGSGLLSLKLGKKPVVQVLPREIQRDPVKRAIIHVDFVAVSLTEKMRLHVPIEQAGVAPISGDNDFVLVRVTDAVEIECLPTDIPGHITADISKLAGLDDEVRAGDLILPANVRLVTDPEHVIFAVTIARAAAVEEEAEPEEEIEAVGADEVEVIAKGKAARAGQDEEE